MAAIRFTVTYLDDTKKDVRITPKAQVMFEEKYGVGMGALASKSMMTHMYFLAWAGLHSSGQEPRDFDTFLDVIADVEAPDGEGIDEEQDPTPNAPGPEPSSP